ncbi:bifunctional non-homologous end joining protein LigD [Haloactinospora alba]|uniref:Bifunctional non-homologous end joining protein LigD n=1 Tax=Haloactinospora alba TaxID=405555 RepID=A0A543NJH0_9ACTN|nr:bifunctional non-homologous end joining protein LigD [Haloactinospora alba]
MTKRDLVAHYREAAPWMLPHVRNRPVALHRFPDGIDPSGPGTAGFFQKRVPDTAPPWVQRLRVVRVRGGTLTMVSCTNAATLAWLADQGVITVHPWLSRAGHLGEPDRLVVDLDPPNDGFARARWAARCVRETLQEAGLVPYVMTTGSRGLHVVVPLRPERDHAAVRELALGVAEVTARRHPDRLTTQFRKDRRGGRLFLDTLRNAYGQHAVAPYAVRPLPGAPVAAPLSWEELEDVDSPRRWSVSNFGERVRVLRHRGNPWRDMARHACSPGKAARRLERMDG